MKHSDEIKKLTKFNYKDICVFMIENSLGTMRTVAEKHWINKHLIVGENLYKTIVDIYKPSDLYKFLSAIRMMPNINIEEGCSDAEVDIKISNLSEQSKIHFMSWKVDVLKQMFDIEKHFDEIDKNKEGVLLTLKKELHASWEKDQCIFLQKNINDFKDQGIFFPKGTLLKGLRRKNKHNSEDNVVECYNGVKIESFIEAVMLGNSLNSSYYDSDKQTSWPNKMRSEGLSHIVKVDLSYPLLILGEYIVLSEIKTKFRWLRIVHFLGTGNKNPKPVLGAVCIGAFTPKDEIVDKISEITSSIKGFSILHQPNNSNNTDEKSLQIILPPERSYLQIK